LTRGDLFPLSLDLNTLNRCNTSCIMCPFAVKYDDHGEQLDPYYRLTLDEYRQLTTGLVVYSAHFVGAYAEPLMNKELFELVAYAKRQGSETAITSNGTLLSRKFSEKLIDAGLDLLTISLHGATKATAEAIMRGADFDRVVANIETLRQVKAERGVALPVVQINYVGQRLNIEELPAFVELAARLGIPFIHFVHLLDGASEVDQTASLVHYPELLSRYVAEARDVARARGVSLEVSPAYQAVIDAFAARTPGADAA
jgi:MoaA/NifB/PqqE/SkfB family radical SAM enzyme